VSENIGVNSLSFQMPRELVHSQAIFTQQTSARMNLGRVPFYNHVTVFTCNTDIAQISSVA